MKIINKLIKQLLLILVMASLSGCVVVWLDKGLNYQEPIEYEFEYNQGDGSITFYKGEKELSVTFHEGICNSYSLMGFIIPFIPLLKDKDCKQDVYIRIVKASDVYIKTKNNQIYKPYKVGKFGTYYFPIKIKALSDTATLFVSKEGENFEIPFRYKHTFGIGTLFGK